MANTIEIENVKAVLELTREMLLLADRGEQVCEGNRCGILFGSLRDYAYKLRTLAEQARAEQDFARKQSSRKRPKNRNSCI